MIVKQSIDIRYLVSEAHYPGTIAIEQCLATNTSGSLELSSGILNLNLKLSQSMLYSSMSQSGRYRRPLVGTGTIRRGGRR